MCPGDAFEKVDGCRELGVLDFAHMATACVGPMSKLLLAEAAGVPHEICYIRKCGEKTLKLREIAGIGCLSIHKSRDDPS